MRLGPPHARGDHPRHTANPHTATITSIGRTVTEASAGAGVDIPATITTTGPVTSISWVVMGDAPNYTWVGSATKVDQAGPLNITPHFAATAAKQYVRYWINGDINNPQYSGPVVVNPAASTAPAIAAPSGSESQDLPGPGGGTVGDFTIVFRGQSNELLLTDHFGRPAGEKNPVDHLATMFQQLTGLTGAEAHYEWRPSGASSTSYSLYSGSNMYHFNTDTPPKWLEPVGHDLTNPTTWANTGIMDAWLAFMAEVSAKTPADRPILVDDGHNEYDSHLNTTAEQSVYLAMRREFTVRSRAATNRSIAKVPFFFSVIAYDSGTRETMMGIQRDAWHTLTQDAAFNCYTGHGSCLDADHMPDDYGSHWNWESAVRGARRRAVRFAKWAWANGNARNDLSWLPTLGPRVYSFARVASGTNQLDLVILHNKGTDLIVPSTPEFDDWRVMQNGTRVPVTGVARLNANTLRLTLASFLTSGSTVTFEFGLATHFSGANSQVTDNWHTAEVSKPTMAAGVTNLGQVQMILQRTRGVLSEGVASTAAPAPPPPATVLSPPTAVTTPYLSFASGDSKLEVKSNTATDVYATLHRPCGQYARLLKITHVNTTALPTSQPFYSGDKPNFMGALQDDLSTIRNVTDQDDGVYVFTVFHVMNDNTTMQSVIHLTVTV